MDTVAGNERVVTTDDGDAHARWLGRGDALRAGIRVIVVYGVITNDVVAVSALDRQIGLKIFQDAKDLA